MTNLFVGHQSLVARAASSHDGKIVKTEGDWFWLVSPSAVFTGMPPVSAEELVKRILLGHIDAHFGSIRETIGG